jgi:hypothetical protein
MDIDSPPAKVLLGPGSWNLRNHEMRIASTADTAQPFVRELLVPNPKLRLRKQVHEVMRFKHYSVRTEEACWHWIRLPFLQETDMRPDGDLRLDPG